MRKKLIIGNWKMNLNMQEASLYLHKLMEVLKPRRDVEVVVSPTTLTLQSLSLQINRRIAKLAAQNCYWRDHGAYTGEVPAAHLRGIADYVLIGHSERRYIFVESDKDIRLKVQAAIRNRLQPILCIGETAQERALGETRDVLADQLTSGLANVTAEELDRVVIAYEPIWAIGTGDNAKPVDVKKATQMIRQHVAHLYGKKAAEEVRILYGVVEVEGATTGAEEAAGADETVGDFTLVAAEGIGGTEGVKDLAGTDCWPATDAATGADEVGEETGTEGTVVTLTAPASASVFGDGLEASAPILAAGTSAL